MAKSEFSYDRDNDDLFLYLKGSKTTGSVEFGGIILDFDKKKVNALEFLDATKTLSSIVGSRVTKKQLACLKATSLESEVKGGSLIIRFVLLSAEEEKISAPIVIPGFNYKSPALAYV